MPIRGLTRVPRKNCIDGAVVGRGANPLLVIELHSDHVRTLVNGVVTPSCRASKRGAREGDWSYDGNWVTTAVKAAYRGGCQACQNLSRRDAMGRRGGVAPFCAVY